MQRFKRYFPSLPPTDGPSAARPRRSEATDSPGPYLVALAFALCAVGLAVAFTAVPAGPTVGVAVTFVVLALASRRIRGGEFAESNRIGRQLQRIARALDRVWGLEFYCLAALSALVWLEASSLARLDAAASAAHLLEAAVWWYPMWHYVAEPLGVATFVLLLASGWTFWVLLGLHPEDEPWLN
jgi:hypothetical protein